MKFKKFGDLNKEILEISHFYNIVANADHDSRLHAHNAYEIMLCKEGSFIFVYYDDNNQKSEILMLKGQFVLVNAGVYHYMRPEQESRILNVEFVPVKGEGNERFTVNCAELFSLNDVLKSIKDKNLPFYIFEDLANVEYEMIKLVEAMTNLAEGTEKALVCRLQLLSILMAVSHCTIYETSNKTGIIHVKKALEFIKENFKEDISVGLIAKHCGINADYLQRLIKKEFGKNVTGIISEYRIKYAKLLLVSRKELNMDEIAGLCGYSARLSLNYEFKKLTGMTASEYKKSAAARQIRKELLPQVRVEEILAKK